MVTTMRDTDTITAPEAELPSFLFRKLDYLLSLFSFFTDIRLVPSQLTITASVIATDWTDSFGIFDLV